MSLTASQPFSPEYFRDASGPGVTEICNDQLRTEVELSRVLPKLRRLHGELALGRADLHGYMFLQYGTEQQIVDSAAHRLTQAGPPNLTSPLKDTILEIAAHKTVMTAPLRLGRISMQHCSTDNLDASFWYFFQSNDNFVYARPGAFAHFHGREYFQTYGQTPNQYIDKVIAEKGEIYKHFLAMSERATTGTFLKKIVASEVTY